MRGSDRGGGSANSSDGAVESLLVSGCAVAVAAPEREKREEVSAQEVGEAEDQGLLWEVSADVKVGLLVAERRVTEQTGAGRVEF